MEKWNNEAASVLLSRTMDHLGYGLPMVKVRSIVYDKLLKWLGSEQIECGFKIAGSKAEGLTKWWESDFDVLVVPSNVISTTNPQQLANITDNVPVFKLDMADTAPGYTRLILGNISRIDEELRESLFGPVSGNTYLSSEKWLESFKLEGYDLSVYATSLPQSRGPSNPISFFNGSIHDDWDVVVGIICDCPELLQSWLDRPRRYSWPSADILREVSTMEAHVVPIGYKGSPLQFLEWRICFTKAEIKLISSFSDCQIKLLILLKWLTKSCLKPICKEMTSYVMKNLVMWMVEKLPEQYFTENNLLSVLHITLKSLKYCLLSKCLPSYMIPDRNLLADRLTVLERSCVCTAIDSLLEQGPRLVNRCEKIRDAFNMLCRSPETFSLCTQSRIYSEIVHLCFMNNVIEANGANADRLINRLVWTAMPDIFELILSGVNFDQFMQIAIDRFKKIMS